MGRAFYSRSYLLDLSTDTACVYRSQLLRSIFQESSSSSRGARASFLTVKYSSCSLLLLIPSTLEHPIGAYRELFLAATVLEYSTEHSYCCPPFASAQLKCLVFRELSRVSHTACCFEYQQSCLLNLAS